MLYTAKWLRSAVVHPEIAQPRPHAALLGKLNLTNHHLDQLAGEVGARFKAIIVQLQTSEDESVAVHFPVGEWQIAQSGQKR